MTSWLFSLALFLVSTMTSKAGWRDAFRYWHSNTTFAIVAECQKWCDKNEREWRKKCTWDTCESCSPCSGLCWSLLSIHTKVPRSESTPRLPFSLVLFDCVADLTSNASSVAVMELRRRAESTTAPFLTHLGTHTNTYSSSHALALTLLHLPILSLNLFLGNSLLLHRENVKKCKRYFISHSTILSNFSCPKAPARDWHILTPTRP